jgi:hypothetical protein
MPDARSDAERLSDTKLYGICLICGTPRTPNRDGRALMPASEVSGRRELTRSPGTVSGIYQVVKG